MVAIANLNMCIAELADSLCSYKLVVDLCFVPDVGFDVAVMNPADLKSNPNNVAQHQHQQAWQAVEEHHETKAVTLQQPQSSETTSSSAGLACSCHHGSRMMSSEI